MMWICLNNAFISAVQHRDFPGHLMVRARQRKCLESAFTGHEITQTPAADYRWRIVISKAGFKTMVNQAINYIDYDNFKNSVDDHDLHDAYSSVWAIMHRLQYLDEPQDITVLDPEYKGYCCIVNQ